ncbi:MAG: hypothetical protein ACI4LB_08080 [Candidatus Fimenecus sp.]
MSKKEQTNEIEKEKVEEEYDTSKEIWDMYMNLYRWNLKDGESNKYWDLASESKNESKNRRKAKITNEGAEKFGFEKFYNCKESILFENAEKENICLSGDIIFNFSQGHYTKQANKYETLLNKLEDEKKKTQYLNKLKMCVEKHHSPENCALLLSNGKLQIAKKSIGDDRGDTFIWALNSYFIGNSEIILNSATPEWGCVLRCFLDSFKNRKYPSKSIYRYCNMFYNITDRKLIDHLILSGAKAIDTPERVCEYIDLAQKFWKKRDKVIKKMSA